MRVVAAMLAALLTAGCSGEGGDPEAHAAHGAPVELVAPPLPSEPGAIMDLVGFHEGRMRLPRPTSVRWEPDEGVLELNFVSDDDGQVFIRAADLDGTTAGRVTVLVEIPLHISAPNVVVRRYHGSDGECELDLSAPVEVGAELTGTFTCVHVSGQRGSELTGAGSFRTGIGVPEQGKREARADATA